MVSTPTLVRSRTCVKLDTGRLAFRTIEIPEPGPGEAIVRTTLATVCGSDIHFLDEFPMPRGVAYVPMGHEAVGIVHALGPGVTSFKVGDRVVASCLYGCGTCANCQRGEIALCLTFGTIPGITNALTGCQGEFYRVPNADLNMARVPDGLTDEQAILVGDVMSTGFAAVERAGVATGDVVVILGQGPVGLCATAASRLHGAGLIIAVERVPERMAMAQRLGATLAIPPEAATDHVLRATNGRGADVAIDAVGLPETFELALAVTRLGGAVSSVGVYGAIRHLTVPVTGNFYQRRIVTTLCPAGSDRLRRLLDLVRFARFAPSLLFTHELPLAEVVRAYELFRRREGGVIKIALRP
jgi:alcohol dehydrogenase